MDLSGLVQNSTAVLTTVAWRVIGAIALWLVGRWLIGFALSLIGRAAAKQQFDVTLTLYLKTALKIVLNAALIVAILGYFGVETTTFAALVAAGGVAIGVAWGGLLSNFAAGAFLVFLRPFKVGDFVTAGGVTGTVETVGLFGTFGFKENGLYDQYQQVCPNVTTTWVLRVVLNDGSQQTRSVTISVAGQGGGNPTPIP